jgi:hypothetical protein
MYEAAASGPPIAAVSMTSLVMRFLTLPDGKRPVRRLAAILMRLSAGF